MIPNPLRKLALIALAGVCVLGSGIRTSGQTPPAAVDAKARPPRVFLDAPESDVAALTKEVPFVAFVPALGEADVHVTVAAPSAATGGEYVLSFIGRNAYQGDNNVLRYVPPPGAPPDVVTKALAQTLRLGLVRYAAKTPVVKRLSVNFEDKVKPTAVADPWHFWVFSLSANGFLSGEQSYEYGSYNGSFSATRVTPDLKLRASLSSSLSRQKFIYEDETIDSRSESFALSGLAVKSLGEHWSAGAALGAQSSSYRNVDREFTIAPAVEYNVFPYADSTKRQLRILYRVGLRSVRYREITIYDRTSETRWDEALNVTLEFKQPWGTVSTSLEGSHYFHDLRRNRLELNGEVSLRVWKGLSFNFDGGGSRIHDQLGLVKAGASLDEVLLRRKQLETSYNYYLSVGVSFTFGSIHSNVVNPRFGDSQGGVSISISN